MCREHFTEKLIELLDVPPAVHIGLAKAERPVPKNTIENALIMNTKIPGPIPADFYIRF